MNTQIFRQIADLNLQGTWCITVQPGEPMVVSIIYKQPCGDSAAKILPAFNLSGTPEEIDATIMERVKKPFKSAAELQTNMDSYMQQLEAVRLRSQQERDKKDKEKSATSEKDKRYSDVIRSVNKLEEEKKYRQAVGKLPDTTEYPEKKEEIEGLRKKLLSQIEPDLFNN